MMNLKKSAVALAVGCAISLPVTVHAQPFGDDTGPYVGLSISRLSADFEDTRDTEFSESDNAAGVRGGYMFSDLWGFELGYLDLGSYSAEGSSPGNDINLNADGFTAAAILNFSITPIMDIYGKLGAFYIDADSSSRLDGRTTIIETDDGAELFGGVGIEADFGQFGLFGEYTAVDTDINELNLSIVTLGVKLEF